MATHTQYINDPTKIATGEETDDRTISVEIKTKGISQADEDSIYDLLNAIDSMSGDISGDIMEIIEQEADDYLYGDRSVEDISRYIQNRM